MKLAARHLYQEKVAKAIEGRVRVGILVYYGGGKTYLALRWLEGIGRFPCLVLCPKSAITQWGSEIEKFTSFTYSCVEGSTEKREKALLTDAQIYIANYDAIRSGLIFATMQQKLFRTVIADESTMLKEARTLRFRRLYSFCRYVPCRTILTGRIVTERPEELFAQLLFLDDGETFGRSYWKFRFTYFDEPPPWNPYKWRLKIGASQVLAKKLSDKCIVVPEETVAAQLPPTQHVRVHFELTPKERSDYNQLKEEFALDFPDGARYETMWVLARGAKLHQLASGFIYREATEPYVYNTRKVEWIVENISELLVRGSVVVWTSYCVAQRIISEALKKANIPHAIVGGELSPQWLKGELDKFLSGNTGVLLIMEQIGYAALNLQCAPTNIFHDCTFSAAMRENAEKRTHRIGSEKTVFYYDLVTKKTLDETVLDAIQQKKDMAEAILKHVRGVN